MQCKAIKQCIGEVPTLHFEDIWSAAEKTIKKDHQNYKKGHF